MTGYVIVGLVCLSLGFAGGRIKNAAKLAAIKAELNKVGFYANDEVKKLIGAIRAKL